MRAVKSYLIASTILATSSLAAHADVKVVASIKPVHSLVAAVMEGAGEPGLIVEGAGSPHTFSLKPSQATMLENADLVFWIGHEMEAFLEKPLETLAAKAKSIELIEAHGLTKMKLREGGAFDAHDHGDHDDHEEHAKHDDHDHEKHEEAKHDEHDHEKHDDHDHEKHADHDDHDHEKHEEAKHDHDDHDHAKADSHDDHAHVEFDVHVWLDPQNAKALVHEIEEALVAADPQNAEKYEANAEKVMDRLDALTAEVAADLEPVKGRPFVVFHDAYQSFENRFGLTAAGSITVSPEVQPGAERITELREKVGELGATCVFSEPQFEPKIVETVTEGTSAKSGVLDPLGASIEDGPDLYFNLIRGMATSFKTCLSKAS